MGRAAMTRLRAAIMRHLRREPITWLLASLTGLTERPQGTHGNA
jgi:hypothetical protein